jgi:transposase
VSVNTVRKWRGRFAAKGEVGLRDASRPGRPRVYGPQVRVAVVATATSVPPGPESTWSHQAIANSLPEVAISAFQVGRILADCDLKPHRVRGWLTRRDSPDFWDRAMDVCSLYMAPPQGAVVLSIDEKTAIAVRSRKHPGRPARPGRAGRQEFEYVRHGTVSIAAALHVLTGEILTEPIAKNDSPTFVGFLRMLDQAIDPNREIHVVMDNGSSHTAQHTREWLAAHPSLARPLHARPRLMAESGRAVLLSPDPPRPPPWRLPNPRRPHRQDRLWDQPQPDRQALSLDLRWHPPQGRLTPNESMRR